MAGSVELRRSKLILLAVLVCVASGGLSALLGAFASLLYGGFQFGAEDAEAAVARVFITRVGTYWGATCGLVAALTWCWLVSRRVAQGRVDRWASWGWRRGVAVGILATTMLHVGLVLGSVDKSLVDLLMGLPFGLLFGVPAGAILGAICGAICQAMVKSSTADQAMAESMDGDAA
ncbi:MAG: hypothetical protein GXY55_17440 [Phycisphaerae bacterium]|nr:hypothetical protein [Phycisphaerae bacterium]